MFEIKQPSRIIFGRDSAKKYKFPKNCLVITSGGAKKRNWLEYIGMINSYVFDKVEPNPSIDIVNQILSEFHSQNFSCVIGIGGGSSLDVAKFVANKLKKSKILIPTTFGSGSEVTRISVLKVNSKKQSFHDDDLLANVAIIDPNFLENTPSSIISNSAIDACAQCSEAFDSKAGNMYTKFLCSKAFELLEDGILNSNHENLVLGSLIDGLGFGNCSTTLGHALSYVYSNEGISHGHALAFTTAIAHKYNKSIFYNRFLNLVKTLGFSEIALKQDTEIAAELILEDRKHLDNNPKPVEKKDIILLLRKMNSGLAWK